MIVFIFNLNNLLLRHVTILMELKSGLFSLTLYFWLHVTDMQQLNLINKGFIFLV